MSESYDATWYDYSREQVTRYGDMIYTSTVPDFRLKLASQITYSGADARAIEEMFRHLRKPPREKPPFPGGRPKNPSDKETTDMASTYALSRDEQYQIDTAVRDAINAPKVAAEIANRKAAVEALGTEDNYAVGTVITFKRKHSKTEYLYVALKNDEERWVVTGGTQTGTGQQTWENLLSWMTTGSEPIVSDVQVAATFTPITWSATPAPADATA